METVYALSLVQQSHSSCGEPLQLIHDSEIISISGFACSETASEAAPAAMAAAGAAASGTRPHTEGIAASMGADVGLPLHPPGPRPASLSSGSGSSPAEMRLALLSRACRGHPVSSRRIPRRAAAVEADSALRAAAGIPWNQTIMSKR